MGCCPPPLLGCTARHFQVKEDDLSRAGAPGAAARPGGVRPPSIGPGAPPRVMEATLDHKVKTCYVVVVAASVVVAATRSCCCYTSCTLCSLRTEHSASLFSPEEERHPPYEQAPSSPSEAVLRGIPHRRAAIASLRSTQGTRQAAGHRNGKLHALFPLVFF